MPETTPMGQTFYPQEADESFPGGCKCWDRSGDCDWCWIYYNGVETYDCPCHAGRLPGNCVRCVQGRMPRIMKTFMNLLRDLVFALERIARALEEANALSMRG
ncbi:hypothetical protein LCGC14_1196590 [marine sediment metagenome]|uniref:Uncharacterized protein n=1 Tax=marine sediment metagenome TaxID=412755 RepID=A0A0F9M5I0_9ZZZZ